MGISFSCFRDIFDDENQYKEFWNIALRESSPIEFYKDCMEIINEGRITDDENKLLKIINIYLISTDKNFVLHYQNFWLSIFKIANKNQKEFELIFSLLLLCKSSFKDFFTCFDNLSNKVEQKIFTLKEINKNDGEIEMQNIEENRIEIVPTNKKKLFELLRYYFDLLTNSILPYLKETSKINVCEMKNDKGLYDQKCIDKYSEYYILNERNNLDLYEFFKRNYSYLNDDSIVREGIRKCFKKIDEEDLTFNITHL